MWVQSTCASSATSASTSTDMWRTDGYLLRFEPCVLPKMSLFPCHHVVSDCVCVQRTLWFQTPFYCYCAHECATQKLAHCKPPTQYLLRWGFCDASKTPLFWLKRAPTEPYNHTTTTKTCRECNVIRGGPNPNLTVFTPSTPTQGTGVCRLAVREQS